MWKGRLKQDCIDASGGSVLGALRVSRARGILMAGVVMALTLTMSLHVDARARKSKRPRFCPRRYKVVSGDRLKDIARELNVKLEDLKKWNGLKSNRVPRNKRLRYRGPCVQSESIGKASHGRLKNGVSIDPDGDNKGNGWVIAARRTALWATPETKKYVYKCAAKYRAYFPKRKAAPIAIGDLSRRHGGRFPPHLSHQSGRDVDIGFINKKRPSKTGRFRRTTPRTLDHYKQWVLTKCFLDNPQTQYIFMEHSLVRSLKRYVKSLYRKRRPKMRKYLSYFPGGSKHVIRGDKEHRSHMHVRFKCPKGDRKCVN
ncbi:MAG: LysM peptidoglycan-binding domain-containing protein [Deltaproteobacteria bacterium]|nr:LysM peptidoglycan-binding domain-containing protein [Deltaproteobacteria bacterium]